MGAKYICNLCESDRFIDFHGRPNVMCAQCGSVERTRALKFVLDKFNIVKSGQRVLHFAPETGIGRHLKSIVGSRYEARDYDPARYPQELKVRKFDLAVDTENLPSQRYDLILHSHVMEHIKCDVTSVLYHLHRSLKRTGRHVFCVPIMWGNYEADFKEVGEHERNRRFGQGDHVRKFGRADIEATIGKVFHLPTYDLEAEFGRDALIRANIPEMAWRGMNSHTFFVLKKNDLKLVDHHPSRLMRFLARTARQANSFSEAIKARSAPLFSRD